MFIRRDTCEAQLQSNGNTRRILGHIPEIMGVEWGFEKGGKGAPHSHPHAQMSYILSGAAQVTVGEETAILQAGDCFYAEPNQVHSVLALEENTRLLDVFTPRRDDFLTQD